VRIGERIRKLRKRSGLTQKEFAGPVTGKYAGKWICSYDVKRPHFGKGMDEKPPLEKLENGRTTFLKNLPVFLS